MAALAAAMSALAAAMSALAVAMPPSGGCDGGLVLCHLRFDRHRVELHQHLTRFHEVTLVHQNFLDPERLLSGGVRELGFETAVAGHDPRG
jgi:hypothetical protein